MAIPHFGLKQRSQYSKARARWSQEAKVSCALTAPPSPELWVYSRNCSLSFQFHKHNTNHPKAPLHSETQPERGEESEETPAGLCPQSAPELPSSAQLSSALSDGHVPTERFRAYQCHGQATHFQHYPDLSRDAELENFPAVFLPKLPGLAAWKPSLFILKYLKVTTDTQECFKCGSQWLTANVYCPCDTNILLAWKF